MSTIEPNLQTLVNEHAAIMQKVEDANLLLEQKKISEEEFENFHQLEKEFSQKIVLLPENIKEKFEEYKLICFIEYEEKLQSLLTFFQAQEENPQLIVKEIKNNPQLLTFSTKSLSDQQIIDSIAKQYFNEFFMQEKKIGDFIQKNKIVVPTNIKNFYIELSEGVEQEYTHWMHMYNEAFAGKEKQS